MTVYVESNFVLELVLDQEQTAFAEEILVRAERLQIVLALPAFSLSEPFSTITHRTRRRRTLVIGVKDQLRDLRRSSGQQQDAAALESVEHVLETVNQRERIRLTAIVDRLLMIVTVIPVDRLIFRAAIRYQAAYGLSAPDSIIYSAVLSHLANNPSAGPHYFINRNRADFDDPEIVEGLDRLGCAFVARFDEGVQRLNQSQVS